jgi:diguanylate cyclase (GGDEF)-like protein/PAS domain S-box-containing protein
MADLGYAPLVLACALAALLVPAALKLARRQPPPHRANISPPSGGLSVDHFLQALGDAAVVLDASGCVVRSNPQADNLLGRGRQPLHGRHLADQLQFEAADPQRAFAWSQSLDALLRGELPFLEESGRLIGRDKEELWVELRARPVPVPDGPVGGAVVTVRNMTDLQRTALRMSYLAQHDALTELPNRLLMTDRLNQAIAQAQRNRQQLGVMFVDIDHFKQINDQFGHAAGDEVLRQVAQAMRWSMRASDTVSRLGGDEFLIILPDVSGATGAAEVAERILAAMAAPICFGEHRVAVSLSIGIALYPGDARGPDDLIRRADAAMYRVKTSGRNHFRLYDELQLDRERKLTTKR